MLPICFQLLSPTPESAPFNQRRFTIVCHAGRGRLPFQSRASSVANLNSVLLISTEPTTKGRPTSTVSRRCRRLCPRRPLHPGGHSEAESTGPEQDQQQQRHLFPSADPSEQLWLCWSAGLCALQTGPTQLRASTVPHAPHKYSDGTRKGSPLCGAVQATEGDTKASLTQSLAPAVWPSEPPSPLLWHTSKSPLPQTSYG